MFYNGKTKRMSNFFMFIACYLAHIKLGQLWLYHGRHVFFCKKVKINHLILEKNDQYYTVKAIFIEWPVELF